MFCQRCGHKLQDNARFCARCGNPVDQKGYTQVNRAPVAQAQRAVPVRSAAQTQALVGLILLMCGFILEIIILIPYFFKQGTEETFFSSGSWLGLISAGTILAALILLAGSSRYFAKARNLNIAILIVTVAQGIISLVGVTSIFYIGPEFYIIIQIISIAAVITLFILQLCMVKAIVNGGIEIGGGTQDIRAVKRWKIPYGNFLAAEIIFISATVLLALLAVASAFEYVPWEIIGVVGIIVICAYVYLMVAYALLAVAAFLTWLKCSKEG